MPLHPSPDDDCDACVPDWAVKRSPAAVAIAALPFVLTFLIVAVAVSHKLFPLLSGHAQLKGHDGAQLPGFAWRERTSILRKLRVNARTLASAAFSTNIALSAVLVELILCEISNTVNPATRALALKITLPLLLFLLVIATPALIIHSVVSNAGWELGGSRKGQRRVAWALELGGLATWLAGFWYIGRGLLGSYLHEASYLHEHTFSEGCLERIGVIGISLMASLAGFAAVSSLWQTFGVKYRPVGVLSLLERIGKSHVLIRAGDGVGHCAKASWRGCHQRYAFDKREPITRCTTEAIGHAARRLRDPDGRQHTREPRRPRAEHSSARDPGTRNDAQHPTKLSYSPAIETPNTTTLTHRIWPTAQLVLIRLLHLLLLPHHCNNVYHNKTLLVSKYQLRKHRPDQQLPRTPGEALGPHHRSRRVESDNILPLVWHYAPRLLQQRRTNLFPLRSRSTRRPSPRTCQLCAPHLANRGYLCD
jgi:hypothetical protein